MMMNSGIADMSAVSQNLPVRRMGKPEEVARAVLWLASDAAVADGWPRSGATGRGKQRSQG